MLIIVLFCVFSVGVSKPFLNPVILVPGDGGSQFKAKLDKPTTVASYCLKKTDYYYDLWLNFEQLVPFLIDCFVDNMRLEYDNVTRTTHSPPGVDIVIPGFGGTETVEYLDESRSSLTTYFHNIAEALVSWGYERNVTLKGAPYDFRKAPNELGVFFVKFKKLIEETYYVDHRRVVLLAHSMGNPTILYFLNKMSQGWKDKFIAKHISLAGVWGGTAKTIRLMISGDNLNIPIVKSISVRIEQRSMPSTAWLLPSDQFWDMDEVLVVAPTRNYTLRDLRQMFKDINYMTGYDMWEDTHSLINPLKAPGVELHCLHGYNVSTPGVFVYNNQTWPSQGFPTTIPDDGDGTVNLRSLTGCLRFRDYQKQPVFHTTFSKAEHLQILNRQDIIDHLKTILVPS